MRTRMIVLALTALAGCTSAPKVPPPTTAWAGTVLTTITRRVPPDFDAVTWSRTMMMTGATAGSESIAEGNGLVRDFRVSDPAPEIAEKLASGLSASLKTNRGEPLVTDLFTFAPGGPGLLLQVRTESWGFSYVPSDPAHYQVKYMGTARLMDAAHPHVIAEATCRWTSDEKDAPGYDELLGGEGALLKQILASAEQGCAESDLKQLLAVPELQQAPAR